MKKKNFLETKIKGLIAISSVNQLDLLGNVKSDILNSIDFENYDVNNIDPNKYYPRSIRGKIHEQVLQRFGENALFYLGFKQFDFIDFKEFVSKMNLKSNKILKMYKNLSFNSGEEIKDRHARNVFVKDILNHLHDGLSGKEKMIVCETEETFSHTEIIDKNTIKFSIKNAVFEKHHEFNRGSIYLQILSQLGHRWVIAISNVKEEFIISNELSLNVFLIKFKYRDKPIDGYKLYIDELSKAKDNFTKSVIESSNSQRKKLEEISSQIGKYIPPQIHDALFAGKYDTEIKTRRRKLTVFFSDIKNFTSTSENLQPEDLTRYLNEYFSEMTKIAIDHGATIDKYIGDAVMLFFGDPETKGEREDARSCVEMALRMQERMEELREKWLNEGFADPFQIRVGLNTGYCNVGNFGSDQRLTYTIIGGEVNVAARLESAAEANGILMSYETYAHVQDMVEVTQKEAIKMKGINREIKIYAVEGRKEVVETKAKPTKAKKPTKKELTKIEHLEKEVFLLKKELNEIKKNLIS